MSVRSGFMVLMAAAGALLAAGCHAPSTDRLSAASSPDAPLLRAGAETVSDKKLVESHARYAEAVIRELNGESEQALADFYLAAINNLEDEALALEVSRRMLLAGKTDQTLELLTRAAGRSAASAALYARLGFVYLQLNKPEQAVKANRIAIKKEPRSLGGYRNLFLTYLQLKQTKEAFEVLEEASKVSQAGPEFLVELAELYNHHATQVPAQKDLARSRGLAALQRAEKLPIKEPPLLLRLAEAFHLLGNDRAAAQIYQDLLKRLPDVPLIRESVREKLTNIYLRDNDHKRAIEQLEGIIRDNPTDAQAYYFLGVLFYQDKNYARAIESFSRTVLLAPELDEPYFDLARAQLSSDKSRDALETLAKAREKFARNSQNFVLEDYSAIAFSVQKDHTNAVKHFNAAEIIGAATNPGQLNDVFYFQYGSACERQGNYAQAEKHFEKCLALSPNFAEAQNYLGYMWAERGEKLERARELITRALKAEPKNAAYLDSMGWVLFKLQQPQEALTFILDAIKNSEEEDATVYDHLGDIYFALNQPEKAREGWTKSLSLERNEAVRKKLEAVPAK